MEHASGSGKRRVAEALWRVVARDGMTGVSVRAVALEAGVTGGTVQHHFPSRAKMVFFSMELLAEQFTQRLTQMPRTGPTRDWTRAILLELLPLNGDRHREFRVWLAFTTHADTAPELTELKRRFSSQLSELYLRLIRARKAADRNEHSDRGSEAESSDRLDAAILQAFIDGLALRLAAEDPEDAGLHGATLLDHFLVSAVDTPEIGRGD